MFIRLKRFQNVGDHFALKAPHEIRCLMRLGSYLPFVMILAGTVGCPGPRVQQTDHLSGPGFDPSMPNASMARWQADFDRLIYDIPRAVKKLHWGLIAVRNDPLANQQETVIRAEALLPNGHVAHMVAWKSQDGFITFVARVGYFGDRRQEGDLIKQLAKVLRGRPSRRHRQAFELPEVGR